MLWSLLWKEQAVLGEISRRHGARLLTSFESRQYMPVIKQRQLVHLKTTFNDDKFFLLAIKKITPLKSSLSLGYNLRKRIMLILLTAVDLICRSTPNYHALHAAWLDNLCLESTSLPSKAFQNFLLISITNLSPTIFIFCSNASGSKIFVTLNQDYLQPSITWQKERACTVLISEFPAPSLAFPGNLHKSFQTILGCPNSKRERIEINKTKHD